ncbi:MAG: NAD(P)/FAD-dependent oxidoreductase [Nitrospiraceae bacterium]
MTNTIETDLCVIGAGSGGLSVAAGAVQLGLRTVLIERAEMGGDCLNTGCIPSKALLAAAKRAQTHRKDDIKGVAPHEPEIDFSSIKDHVFDTIKAIESHDSQERFEQLGVTVIRDAARFTAPDIVVAGAQTIKARHFVVATGSRAAIPRLPGLEKAKVFTNETIFALRERPEHLLIIGGGPIGIEMAQAHRRLGCKVSVIDMGPILPRDDQKNVEIVRQALQKEGVALYENVKITAVAHLADRHTVSFERTDGKVAVDGTHMLLATGRSANTDALDLERAGIVYGKSGITVDARMRTTNKKIYAIGDVSGGPQFTHVAGYHAGIVIRNICFKIPATVNYNALPWVTYCDPELAQVGLTENAAREKYGDGIKVTEWAFGENDRAVAERRTNGQIRVITKARGLILGASIVGPQAGELISLWALAISSGLKIGAITSMIMPFPTLGEVSKRAAGAWYTPRLFSDKTRRIVKFIQKLPF